MTVHGVEGPTWPALDTVPAHLAESLLDGALRCARLVETDPAVIATSAHLLAIAARRTTSEQDISAR